ncbi:MULTISPECIES: hypothetical protein [unclassified Bradyrhizobium]|uniref:hypothetical protein n=1 Tax=unclassified Bradyrhizobium TaxID=2631580 RepID=UPI002915FE2F|nr:MULTISPECIES: hypothetical protein [unclassified Bradyrhizobium]
MPGSNSISTSPLALQAYHIIKHLDRIVGPAEAQSWMLRSNELLGGITPVSAIKERRTRDLHRAVWAVCIEKGIFEEPVLSNSPK